VTNQIWLSVTKSPKPPKNSLVPQCTWLENRPAPKVVVIYSVSYMTQNNILCRAKSEVRI